MYRQVTPSPKPVGILVPWAQSCLFASIEILAPAEHFRAATQIQDFHLISACWVQFIGNKGSLET